MVYFECSCGESLKKPKVAKHMMYCRHHYFTCIDCMQVFQGEEYKCHTVCMSEAQKVQGKLFDAAAEQSKNKGAKKQDDWVVRVHAATKSATGQMKEYFIKLQNYTNIPRKKKPFSNFVANSLRMWNPKQVEELWAAIEAACPAPAPTPAPAATPAAPAEPKKRTLESIIDEVLDAAGGQMKWRKLASSVQEQAPKELLGEGDAEDRIVAAIPTNYTNDADAFVRKC